MPRDPLLELLLGKEESQFPDYRDPYAGQPEPFATPQIQEPLPETARRLAPQGRGSMLLDDLARAFQDVGSPGGYGAPGDVFGANVASGVARGFSRARMGRMEERAGTEKLLREDARLRNERNARATIAARIEKQRTLDRQERAAKLKATEERRSFRLSKAIAERIGAPERAGEAVTPSEYANLYRTAFPRTRAVKVENLGQDLLGKLIKAKNVPDIDAAWTTAGEAMNDPMLKTQYETRRARLVATAAAPKPVNVVTESRALMSAIRAAKDRAQLKAVFLAAPDTVRHNPLVQEAVRRRNLALEGAR